MARKSGIKAYLEAETTKLNAAVGLDINANGGEIPEDLCARFDTPHLETWLDRQDEVHLDFELRGGRLVYAGGYVKLDAGESGHGSFAKVTFNPLNEAQDYDDAEAHVVYEDGKNYAGTRLLGDTARVLNRYFHQAAIEAR